MPIWRASKIEDALDDTLTLDDIRREKERVETEILGLIQNFKEVTGLAVIGIEVEQIQTTTFGFGFEAQTTGLRLRLEDI